MEKRIPMCGEAAREDNRLHNPSGEWQARTRILRRPEVERMSGLSCSTIYEKVANGTFPAPVRLGAKAVGWREDEVLAWIESRPRAGTRKGEAE